jgi:hypothetical protein
MKNMNVDIAGAIALLQARASFYESRDHWRTEQAEEALNLLLAQPERQGDPKYLVRNALADARKKLSRRAEILNLHGSEIDWLEEETSDDFAGLLIETTDFLTHCLDPADRALLELACCGEAADAIATRFGLPIARVREELSRARARARGAAGLQTRRTRRAAAAVTETDKIAPRPTSPTRMHLHESKPCSPFHRRAGSLDRLSQLEH